MRRVVAASERQRRCPQREQRETDHQHADHVADRVFNADRGNPQIGLRREHVGDVEHQWRAQVVEHFDEHQCRTGDIPGHRQRKHNAAEQAQAAGAEILRRLLHGAVDVIERDHQVHQDEREVVQRFDEDHAVQTLHDRQIDVEPLAQQQVERAAASEQQLHRHRADERRHDQRQYPQRLDQQRAAKFKAHREVRERQRNQRCKYHRQRRHAQAVPEGFAHQGYLEERGKVLQRQAAIAVGKSDVNHHDHRHNQKNHQEQRDRQRDPGLHESELPGRGRAHDSLVAMSRTRRTPARSAPPRSGWLSRSRQLIQADAKIREHAGRARSPSSRRESRAAPMSACVGSRTVFNCKCADAYLANAAACSAARPPWRSSSLRCCSSTPPETGQLLGLPGVAFGVAKQNQELLVLGFFLGNDGRVGEFARLGEQILRLCVGFFASFAAASLMAFVAATSSLWRKVMVWSKIELTT